MKYSRFEDLPVWQSAIELADRVYELTRQGEFRGPGDLADQLRRAALSISNNIAEGFEQGTTAQLLSGLYIARGSAGEVRSMLRFCERAKWMHSASAGRVRAGNTASSLVDPSSQPSNRQSEISNLRSEISNPECQESDSQRHVQGQSSHRRTQISNLKSEISRPGGESQISDLKSEILSLIALAESCSRQLRAWADKLQNSDIPGQRHLTDKSRNLYQSKQRADAFWKQCEEVVQKRLAETQSRWDSREHSQQDRSQQVHSQEDDA